MKRLLGDLLGKNPGRVLSISRDGLRRAEPAVAHALCGSAAWLGLALVSFACATASPPKDVPPLVGEAPTPLSALAPPPEESSAPPPAPVASVAPVVNQAPPARTCELWSKPQVLRRAPLRRILDAGLARWLQGVEGDRVLGNHRFQGWMVKSLHPSDPCYESLDLRAGDIVQKVNGRSIERPEQAFDVAESLRNAPALTIDFIRDGKPRKLSLAIVDE